MKMLFRTALAASGLLLASCAEDGDYEVATRQKVDRSELPELGQIGWSQDDFDSFVVSEAYAKIVPEAKWPGPIGEMLNLVARDPQGNLPEGWDLPIDDRCLYIGIDHRRPSWRLHHRGRTLFFVPYQVPSSNGTNETAPRNYLAALDESQSLRRYDIGIASFDIKLLQRTERLLLVERDVNALLLRDITIEGSGLEISDPSVLVEPESRLKNWTVELDSEGAVHVAWSIQEGSGRQHPAFYARFDGQALTEEDSLLLTRSSTGNTVKLIAKQGRMLAAWQDSRFASGLVGVQNASKLFFARVDWDSLQRDQPTVVNQPYEESDGASAPIFAKVHNDRVLVFWSTTLTGELQWAELRYSIFDDDDRRLTVAEGNIEGASLLDAATKRLRRMQRGNPIGDQPGPTDQECDLWEEKVRSLPLQDAGPIDIHGRPMPLIKGGHEEPDDS
ncbi:hypothetical protein [Wenzhouxiangella sp. EGI_FJ10409]|uniref:hypothetical protein n=1 Tax=Wenzhouxiangella sp. EGI_FJ10409 TaxID=3243767 RepID=UPI0035DEA149